MYILNGTLYKDSQNTVSPLSQAFMFGYGLFETLRIEDGEVLLFDEHLKRLKKGLETLRLKLDYREEDILRDCKRLIETNKLRDGVLKISFSKGDLEDYLLITTRDNPYTRESYKRGFKLVFSKYKRNNYSSIVDKKTNNYLENLLEKQQASENGFDEVLFLNTDDFLAEGAVSNVFWISDRVAYTPDDTCGLLPGIVREKVIEAIKALDIEVRLGKFKCEKLLDAEEVFLTNSLMDIMPVKSIGEIEFSLKEDSLTRMITEKYKSLTRGRYE